VRTPEEQVHGLSELQRLVPAAWFVLPSEAIDVAALRVGDREVVYAVGGYDLWSVAEQHLLATDLTKEEAAEALRREYEPSYGLGHPTDEVHSDQ